MVSWLIPACGGGDSAVGTCICTCVISGAGTNVNKLTGAYTKSECESAAKLVEQGGTNECGNFLDGSVVCSSAWTESSS